MTIPAVHVGPRRSERALWMDDVGDARHDADAAFSPRDGHEDRMERDALGRRRRRRRRRASHQAMGQGGTEPVCLPQLPKLGSPPAAPRGAAVPLVRAEPRCTTCGVRMHNAGAALAWQCLPSSHAAPDDVGSELLQTALCALPVCLPCHRSCLRWRDPSTPCRVMARSAAPSALRRPAHVHPVACMTGALACSVGCSLFACGVLA